MERAYPKHGAQCAQSSLESETPINEQLSGFSLLTVPDNQCNISATDISCTEVFNFT